MVSSLAIPTLGPGKVDWQAEQVASGDKPHEKALSEIQLDQVVTSGGKTDAVLYAWNLQFFLDHALHSKADFFFIINGYELTATIPEADNIFVTKRENSCYDLGSFGVVLRANDGALLKKYKRFLMTNSSVRGPIFPNWARANKEACWTNKFFGPLSDRVKLVGLTAKCQTDIGPKHLQSFALATDRLGMDFILPALQCFSNRKDAINKGELAITSLVKDAGYEALPLYARYNEVENTNQEFWAQCTHTDVQLPANYAGMDAHPFDLMFTKNPRIVIEGTIDPFSLLGMVALNRLTEWADASKFSSYEQCG